MNEPKLKVNSIEISDCYGVKECVIKPGKITVLRGKNATGKSSVLNSLQSLIKGGALANISRIGDNGEEIDSKIVLVLESDEGQKFLAKKTGSGTVVKSQVGDSAGYEDVKKPQSWLTSLYDEKMSNPLEFIQAKQKERVLMLLGALDVDLDREKLWADMAISPISIGPIPEGLHPLQELSFIRDAVFTKRTGVNRDEKAKRSSGDQILREIPEMADEGAGNRLDEINSELSSKRSEIEISESQIIADYKNKTKDALLKKTEIVDRMDRELKIQIEESTRELEIHIAKLKSDLNQKISKMKDEVSEQKSVYTQTMDDLIQNAAKEKDEKLAALNAEKEKNVAENPSKKV